MSSQLSPRATSPRIVSELKATFTKKNEEEAAKNRTAEQMEDLKAEVAFLKLQLRVAEKKLDEERKKRQYFESQALAHIEFLTRKVSSTVHGLSDPSSLFI
eukprot:TRINITY_DN1801_c0_g1_i1.p2 TRINITY_DN1801_c0_g1~~TRINITY_DN1801_c0_g1_i1.p2  ORF type:complete len:110 (+),score=49.62 TRINITY_DN1801_c0_g1_i1:29-331(+)